MARPRSSGFSRFDVSISDYHRKTNDAIAYYRERRRNISDKFCEAIELAYERDEAIDKNENILFYTDAHQAKLSTLPRVTEYLRYLDEGNKDLVSLYLDGQLNISDLYDAYSSASRVLSEISNNPKAKNDVLNLVMEGIKSGSKK